MRTDVSAASPIPDRGIWLARVILGVQVLAVVGWLSAAGRLRPELVNDSPGYVDFPWSSLEAALSSIRTPAFPAFVRVADLFGADHRAVPILVFSTFTMAAMLFFEALRFATGSVWVSACSASALLYANILHGYVQTVATDTLAAAMGIASCSAVLFWLRRPCWWTSAAVTGFVTLAWLVRPANLFVCVLVPVGAGILRGIIPTDQSGRRFGPIVGLAMATCLPPTLYSTLRWSVVGQWGIVSFGGYNAIGIAGQFITPDVADRLPESHRPIIQGALARRERRPKSEVHLDAEPRLHYLRMERHYDLTIWDEFAPAAAEMLGEQPARINSELGQLAMEAIRLRPGDFAVWLAKATRQGVKKLFWDNLDNPVSLVVLLTAGAAFLIRIFQNQSPFVGASGADRTALLAVVSVAILYAAFSLAVAIPVCPPFGRMTDAAGVLMPAALFGTLAVLALSNGRSQ